MKIKTIQLLLFFAFVLGSHVLHSQEFKTTFIAESRGYLDSVVVGYDPTASIQIDAQFGEQDINYTPFDSTFEVRVGQIDLEYRDCGTNIIDPSNPFLTYMSKVDILPKTCTGWDPSQTNYGTIPYATLLVRKRDLPVTLSWDTEVFQDTCVAASLVTDWNPNFWPDVTCGALVGPEVSLGNANSATVIEQTEMTLLDNWGDTLCMLYIVLDNPSRALSTDELLINQANVYPNPASNTVVIESEGDIELLEIYDGVGTRIETIIRPDIVDVRSLPRGIYFFKLFAQSRSVLRKVIVQR